MMARRISAAIAASCLLLGVAVATADPASAVQSKPRTSVSRYVTTSSTSTAYNWGCAQGTADAATPIQDSEVILDFGAQLSSNTGATAFSGTDITYAQIAAFAEQYARGYWICTGSDTTSTLHLAIGTNSSGSPTSAMGTSWANSVVDPAATWVYANTFQVAIDGANDIELSSSWGSLSQSRAWVAAYDSAANSGRMVDYGDAAGCSQTSYANALCNDGWHQADVWYVSWASRNWPLPEVYYSSQSKEWTEICLYGYHYQTRLSFDGPLTQAGYGGTYTAAQGWSTFWTDLSNSGACAQSLLYSSDI